MNAEDRLALHELPGRYGDIIDNRDWPGLASIFTLDATCEVNGKFMDSLKGIQEYMSQANHPLAHLMVNVYADETDEGVILHSRVITWQRDGTVKSGRYRDIVVKGDQGWRVQKRVFASTPRPEIVG